jgi:hypothetical protein
MDSRYRLYINASDYQLATNISYVPYDQISTSYYGDGPGTVLISALEPCCGVVLEAEDPRTELLLDISLVVKRQVRLRNGRTSLRGSQENFLGKDL